MKFCSKEIELEILRGDATRKQRLSLPPHKCLCEKSRVVKCPK